jgi:N-acyl-D-amino-acid deacylase
LIDILIKNGTIVDGKNKPSYSGDIAISNGKIVAIEKFINTEAKENIDANGLIVAPGFIDVHSHNDLIPFMGNKLDNLKLNQGVTTELVGQCGLGVVPCIESETNVWKNYIRGVVGEPNIEWKFQNMKDYMNKLKLKGLKNNYAVLISHGAIRTRIIGFANRIPNENELKSMCKIVKEAMEAGAFGMSIGLQYMPAIFSEKEELIAMCKVVKDYNGIIMVHLRNHDDTILKALDEIVEIADNSGVRLHVSHLRSYNSKVLGCNADALIEAIEKAADRGINITFDEHLYLSGSTLMTQLLPPWVTNGGTEMMLQRLKDYSVLNKLKEELSSKETHYLGWDNYSLITDWKGILISSVRRIENLKYIGKTVSEIAESLSMHPVDFIAKLLIEEQTGVGIVTMDVFSVEDTIKLIKHPLQMVGSDSIPAGVPHPRLYGNYPLFLGKFVRDKKVLSIEEAIYKCTLLPAKTLGLKDTGELLINKKADITIFNLNEITGYEDYRNPTKAPKGIKHVIINGKIVLRNGETYKENYGQVIKYNLYETFY